MRENDEHLKPYADYTVRRQQEQELSKKHCHSILIVDDDPDITFTFQVSLEGFDDGNTFKVYTSNDPLSALFEFKPNFYDLLLIDINLPHMNGFELYEKISKIDLNAKVCFMSAGEVNHEALREIHPASNIGCFIQKPVTIDCLVKILIAELE
jgi:DNA-binding NtrC family response regulator